MSKQTGWKVLACAALVAVCALLTIVSTEAAAKLDAKLARKLIAKVAGIELSTDAVKVKEISALGSSATVVAQVETAFQFALDERGNWRVAQIRTGNNKWEDVNLLVRAVNLEKAARAGAELETLATALQAFRRERGFYPVTSSEAVLVDQLNPRYMASVIRVDPWHMPYIYEGAANHYVLRSAGPDGKADTTDDVIRTGGE